MSERWQKVMSEGRVLVVELAENVPVRPRASLPDERDVAAALITYPDGLTQRYSSLDKARRILTGRGFVRSQVLVASSPTSTDDEPPRRAI